MPITNYDEAGHTATELLQQAVFCERKRDWPSAIFAYKRMICLISPDNLPPSFIPTDRYRLALYEAYEHLAQAYQKEGDHSLALRNFSKAIDIISTAQFGCAVECRSSASLTVPVLCRRAHSFSILGKYKAAMKDVNVAMSIEEKNMDILCLAVLVHNTFEEYNKAMRLLVKGLGVNKTHVGCRLLRKSLKEEGCSPKFEEQSIEGFREVTTLLHPGIMEFIERYLHSLNVPHTVQSVELVAPSEIIKEHPRSRFSSCTQCRRKPELRSLIQPSPSAKLSSDRSATEEYDLSWKRHELCNILPFKVGALPSKFERDPVQERNSYITKHRRRDEYSETLRIQAHKMKCLSQDEFTKMLENSQSRKRLLDWKLKKQQGLRSNQITISAFPPVDTQNVPRLYPKGWKGDRLQSAPLPHREYQPIFYPAYS